MPESRCDQCKFWTLEHGFGEQKEKHPDDRIGVCHRHAPRPTTGDHEYYLLRALWLIAPADDELDKNWEEARLQNAVWVGTQADDWCGEFIRKDDDAEADE
jgi:hypothetical protein